MYAQNRSGVKVLISHQERFEPEGTYLQSYWPYFTAKYNTAWGAAVNYDDEGCAVVRQMVLESVRHWVERYHLDGLRLDAVHAIHDQSTRHILREIAETALALSATPNKRIVIIAETDENNVRVINPTAAGGFGLDAQKKKINVVFLKIPRFYFEV